GARPLPGRRRRGQKAPQGSPSRWQNCGSVVTGFFEEGAVESVRVGFIGCGGIAQQHLKGLAELEGVELAAVCDVREQASVDTAGRYGGRSFTDHTAMLAEVPLDALFIVLPPFAHGPAERAAIERNLPFFVEKPVGIDLGACREIAQEVERRNLL